MNTTQITSFGNSVGIVLPPEVLQKLNVATGDQVCLVETATGIELKRMDPALAEQFRAVEQVMDEDDEALRQLAQ